MKGIGTSWGIGIGKVFLFKEPEIKIIKQNITDINSEITRFQNALNETIKEINKIHDVTLRNIGEEEAEIFIAHRMMLEDPEFISSVVGKIENEKVNAEIAVSEVVDFYVSLYEDIEDEYLKSRSIDLKDVSKRLLRAVMGINSPDLSTITEKSIIIAEDLTPSATAQMNKEMVVGIVTEFGGRTSHTSIIARTLEVPAIVGAKDITRIVSHGDKIIIDGGSGEILINPSIDDIEKYEAMEKKLRDFRRKLSEVKYKESISKDGYTVEISGNIGTPNDIDKVIENGGEGVGLYRTEFLFMDRDRIPSEEEQFVAYKVVAQKLENRPLVIRTLDVGGDKDLPYLNLPKEVNPFLGYRAIRLCLDKEEVFRTQLRAILRASAFGNIKVMFLQF